MFHNKSFIATFLLILAATIQGHRSKTMHQRSHSSQAVGLDLNPVDKESMCNTGDAGDPGLIPVSERSLRGRHSNPLQYSCLQNSMDRGAWQATVHSVTKSQTQLKWLSTAHVGYSMGPMCWEVGLGHLLVWVTVPSCPIQPSSGTHPGWIKRGSSNLIHHAAQ